MKAPEVKTRRERAEDLEKLGVTGHALEALCRETSTERHKSRVDYAIWAAEEYYLAAVKLDRDEMTEGSLRMAAGAILWADLVGVGGKDGVDGTGTRRHPAFLACGKGRKQAADGMAWSVAILEAALATRGRFEVNVNGCLVFRLEDHDAEVGVDETIAPRQWIYSILREGLRRAAGVSDPWHPNVPFNCPASSLSAWAELVNNGQVEKSTHGY